MNKIANAGNPQFCKIFMATLLMRPIMIIYVHDVDDDDDDNDDDEYICADAEGMKC